MATIKLAEMLNYRRQHNNAFDCFAINSLEADPGRTTGNLSMEITRATKFLMNRGAKVIVKLTEIYYRRSPLVEGGLEILCLLVVKMNYC